MPAALQPPLRGPESKVWGKQSQALKSSTHHRSKKPKVRQKEVAEYCPSDPRGWHKEVQMNSPGLLPASSLID